ncbi:MAG: RusA family crossover junction endodeoxyribonuclease [Clostridia bacterium]|nr:RusA family crossover junction endodeoxyribonuclease [Clostridia bacterium]
MTHYTIPLAPVTKKNSNRILTGRKGNKYIAPSEQYEVYARSAGWFLRPVPRTPIDSPVTVKCLFFVPDKRRRDLTNLLEAVDDVLVENHILADDCYAILASHDGSRVFVDKENPRTEIYIEEYKE